MKYRGLIHMQMVTKVELSKYREVSGLARAGRDVTNGAVAAAGHVRRVRLSTCAVH